MAVSSRRILFDAGLPEASRGIAGSKVERAICCSLPLDEFPHVFRNRHDFKVLEEHLAVGPAVHL